MIQIYKEIHGPQSTILFIKYDDHSYVEKVSTERGESDLLDQVSFYLNLCPKIEKLFPKLIAYDIKNKPYKMRLELCPYPTLRKIMLDCDINSCTEKQINKALRIIHRDIHSIESAIPTEDYVQKLYIDRCIKRINETQNMLSENAEWFNKDFYINNVHIRNPITKAIQIIEKIKGYLIPEYICTTHGQLGPSHLLLNMNITGDFKLLDPKGFNVLHDPIIDLCKLGKAFIYGTEWLEESLFDIEYILDSGHLKIQSFEIQNYNRENMISHFENIIKNGKEYLNLQNINLRLYAMMCSDLIGSLPFGMKAGGEKRVVALLVLIHWALTELMIEVDKLSIKL
ncbi:hypothetical protein [Bacillus mycoides]